MTSEKEHKSLALVVPFGGHKAQVGHRSKNALCPSKPLYYFCFLMKRHKAQDREGGHLQNVKGGKMAQKEGKREENIIYQQNRKSLCPVPFEQSGALA